ncbi:MAG: DUF4234 domain-containing protein [Oscillospiraceae bacterium]|nr:DUF4234 domain-containing protein [Oscillospiraceae bacterium]
MNTVKKFILPFNLNTVTAFLCILVMVFSLCAYFTSEPMAAINSGNGEVDRLKTNIADYEASIEQCETAIEACSKELEELTAQLPAAKTAYDEAAAAILPVEEAALAAENALQQVCTRKTYNVNSCTDDCKPLHEAFSEAKSSLEDARAEAADLEKKLNKLDSSIVDLQGDIEDLNDDIQNYNNKIASLKEQISDARSRSAGAWFGLVLDLVLMVLTMGALGLLVKTLIAGAKSKKALFISCGALGISALLFLLPNLIGAAKWGGSIILLFITCPHSYTILAMVMFARILMKKAKKPVVCRTVAIVAAVIAVFLSSLQLGYSPLKPLASVLFGIVIILLAFVVEPLVFTEYIKIAKHIFLTLITCGIWLAVWAYHVTKNLNKVSEAEERTPRNELLLCMFLPFYAPYWTFKTAETVESYGKEMNKSLNLEVLALVFAFICPPFATVMIQNKINVIVGKPE